MHCTRLAANTGRKKWPSRAVSSQLRHVSTIGKNVLSSNISSTCPDNMVNFGPLTAEIVLGVWGTPPNFNEFRVLSALLHGTLVVGISQTLRHRTEGATYIRQGGHHIGHWPTFLVLFYLPLIYIDSCNYTCDDTFVILMMSCTRWCTSQAC